MSSNTHARPRFGPLLRLLVTYRNPIYVGGLAVTAVLFVLSRVLGVAVPETARTVVVVVALGVMVVTYAAERLVGHDHLDPESEEHETYPLRMRAAVALAVLGVALGIYLGLEVNPLTGVVFVVGAYFFAYMGYRGTPNGGT